jgi:FKBP12-rapamycin complex-associated protein
VRITHYCLQLLAELALSLRDDLRPHVPELLPRFVGLFVETERSGVFDMVRPALGALEVRHAVLARPARVRAGPGWAGRAWAGSAGQLLPSSASLTLAPSPAGIHSAQALGVALEEHLHLLLPALMRLASPAVSGTPLDVRRAVLRSLKRLLPRMRLLGFGSALLHPLIKVLDGPNEELRRDALDTMCALAVALGEVRAGRAVRKQLSRDAPDSVSRNASNGH